MSLIPDFSTLDWKDLPALPVVAYGAAEPLQTAEGIAVSPRYSAEDRSHAQHLG
jgi:hypothetical protein